MVRGPTLTTVAISDLCPTQIMVTVCKIRDHHKNEPRRSEPSGFGCLNLGFYCSAARGVGGMGWHVERWPNVSSALGL